MEVLSPAGNLAKVKYAVAYGADAVYAGSQDFSLRAKADRFDQHDLLEAVKFCHQHQRKLFVPLNIYAHNRHLPGIRTYLEQLSETQIDALIVSDLGVLDLVQHITPHIPVHISTQANVTSYQAALAYQKLGAKRIILARELTYEEIHTIREKCPDLELEIFIHGAMCISYSGRCLLSAFLNNRSANLGECTHPCRWKYSLVEESRPTQFFGIEEDQHGFYFMNAKDLCLWEQLSLIFQMGIDSIKIEGRMKSLYYIAAVTRAYKQAILSLQKSEKPDPFWQEELQKVSHRVYTKGFFQDYQAEKAQNYESAQYFRHWQFVGNLLHWTNGYAYVQSYHKIQPSDMIEFIFPAREHDFHLQNFELFDENKQKIVFTKPNSVFLIKIDQPLPEYGILRKKTKEQDFNESSL